MVFLASSHRDVYRLKAANCGKVFHVITHKNFSYKCLFLWSAKQTYQASVILIVNGQQVEVDEFLNNNYSNTPKQDTS